MSSQDPKQEDATPWNKDTAAAFNMKSHSKFFDPCQEAAERSYRCLTRNNGEKEYCTDYFQAYKECKKQWTEKRKQEKAKNGWFG